MPIRRHPPQVRALAVRLAAERQIKPTEVRRVLLAEHSYEVPLATLKGWLNGAGPELPADRKAAVSTLAERALALTGREISALERAGRGKADLSRLASLAQILKTLDGLRPSQAGSQGLRELAKLDDATPSNGDVPFSSGSSADTLSVTRSEDGRDPRETAL